MLEYKGYNGRVEYDGEAQLFHGEVLGTRDVITFQGMNVEEIEEAFRDSIDDYLEYCQERGEDPDKPFSGRLMVRLPSEIHRELYLEARREGKSLNQIIIDRLARTG